MKLDDGYCPRDCLCDGCRERRARAEWASKRIDRPFLIDGKKLLHFDEAWLRAENLRAHADIARALGAPGVELFTTEDVRLLKALKIDPWK